MRRLHTRQVTLFAAFIPGFYNGVMVRVTLPLADSPNPLTAPDRPVTGPRDLRAVRTLRISVTDRCNFRCVYCMPQDKIDGVRRERLLSFEEIAIVARTAVGLGITAFKITGGEPLVRHDLAKLIAQLKVMPGCTELSMTTNGALLAREADRLRAAGLDRLTVSLDTLDADRFRRITRGADIDEVLRGINAAVRAGFRHPKINCVAMRGINDDEFADFAALTLETDVTVRFIEYMPLGRTALGGEYEQRFISEQGIRDRIAARLGNLAPSERDTGHGPAAVWRVPGARGRIGFISAMSRPFCETCNRLRLTAEGQLRSCLFDGGEVELRPILRLARPDGSRGYADANAALSEAFDRCVAFKPKAHSHYGNRQMSQIGG
ncbi:MAG: GTP 3',8-cyclase MoaA [Phycisphaerae bacterium]